MQQHLTSCLVVARREGSALIPLGIVTDRDLSHLLSSANESIGQVRIDAVMSSPPVLCHQDTSLGELVCIMHGSGTRRLPVVDDCGHMKGIVTANDVLVAITELLRRLTEVLMVEPALDDRMSIGEQLRDSLGCAFQELRSINQD